MVSMHLALEVHLNGRSIQAYLLGDVVVFVSCQVRFNLHKVDDITDIFGISNPNLE